VEPSVTIPFPDDLFEALAQRIAALLSEQPPVQRYLDAEAAALYPGVPVKTLRTKEWRDRERIPVRSLAQTGSAGTGFCSAALLPVLQTDNASRVRIRVHQFVHARAPRDNGDTSGHARSLVFGLIPWVCGIFVPALTALSPLPLPDLDGKEGRPFEPAET
jgi:hypothetical protein